ncbi:MAG: hypothetical protein V4760_03865 [Bdellovibrionota bacterium]
MKSERLPLILALVGSAMVVFSVANTVLRSKSKVATVASRGSFESLEAVLSNSAQDSSASASDVTLQSLTKSRVVESINDIGYTDRARGALDDLYDWAKSSDDGDEAALDQLLETYSDFAVDRLQERIGQERDDPSHWTESVNIKGKRFLIRRTEDGTTSLIDSGNITVYGVKQPGYLLMFSSQSEKSMVHVKFDDGSVLYSTKRPDGSYWSFEYPDGREIYRFLNPDGTPKYPR